MDLISALLIALSAILASCRNLLVRNISDIKFGNRAFYFLQATLFGTGAVALAIVDGKSLLSVAPITVLYALIYAVMLVSTQWCYTFALGISGQIGICATVMSLGFIFPTMAGMIFWSEETSVFKIIGIAFAICTVVVSGMTKKGSTKTDDEQGNGKKSTKFIIPLCISMASSGGLGIVQKLQQKSGFGEQKGAFVIISFVVAAAISLLFALTCGKRQEKAARGKLIAAAGAGICFGVANLLNTSLAGTLDGAIFFPTLNISAIFLSLALSIIIFKERFTVKHACVIALGAASILLISLF
jgi:drug/metabolite transporter (DMT)-like permease